MREEKGKTSTIRGVSPNQNVFKCQNEKKQLEKDHNHDNLKEKKSNKSSRIFKLKSLPKSSEATILHLHDEIKNNNERQKLIGNSSKQVAVKKFGSKATTSPKKHHPIKVYFAIEGKWKTVDPDFLS